MKKKDLKINLLMEIARKAMREILKMYGELEKQREVFIWILMMQQSSSLTSRVIIKLNPF